MRVRVNLVLAGARPMRRTSSSPLSPSRISEADYARPPASPATCPGSFQGLLGPNSPAFGSFVRVHGPEPHFRHHPLVAWELTTAWSLLIPRKPGPPCAGSEILQPILWSFSQIRSKVVLWCPLSAQTHPIPGVVSTNKQKKGGHAGAITARDYCCGRFFFRCWLCRRCGAASCQDRRRAQ